MNTLTSSSTGRGETNLFRPVIFGLLASIVAAILWATFGILTGWEIGYIAIGAAILISWAVLKGSGQVKNLRIQIAALILTFFAVFLSHLAILIYFVLKFDGNQSDFFYAMLGVWFTPSSWGVILQDLIATQGAIGWLIIAIAMYTTYSKTDPRVKIEPPAETAVKEKMPDGAGKTTEARDVKVDRKISAQITGYTALNVFIGVVILMLCFNPGIPEIWKFVMVLGLIALSAYIVRQIKSLKQKHPEQFELNQKINNKLSIKRVLLGSLLGFIAIVGLLVIVGLIYS